MCIINIHVHFIYKCTIQCAVLCVLCAVYVCACMVMYSFTRDGGGDEEEQTERSERRELPVQNFKVLVKLVHILLTTQTKL